MTIRDSKSGRVEFYALCVLLFVLPILEAPKNLALVVFVVAWAVRRFSLASLRRYRPDIVEIAIVAVIVACVASIVASWPFPAGTKGLVDTLRYTLVFWCIYRSGYGESKYRTLAVVTAAGLIAGLVVGVIEVIIGTRHQLELHSAGVLTHSAIFVSVVFVMVLGIVITRWLPKAGKYSAKGLAPWVAALVLMMLALLVMGSRGALAALVFTVLALVVLVNRRRLWVASALTVLVLAGTAFAMLAVENNQGLFGSMKERFVSKRMDSSNLQRDAYWRIAMAQVRQGDSPWFGIGPRNFHGIDVSQLSFDPPLHGAPEKLHHAHNLFLNKLVEEGVVGLGALLFFLGTVVWALFATWRAARWYDWKWIAAFGAFTVPVIAGSFNTPFYQEHAILACAMFAIFMGARRTAVASSG